MQKRAFLGRLICFLSALSLAGCHDSDSTGVFFQGTSETSGLSEQAQSVGISIVLPVLPFTDSASVKVDRDLITGMAQAYCLQAGDTASGPAFFLGYLPLAAADALGGEGLDADMAARHLGSLAVSGYFGGVWLRDALADRQAAQALSAFGLGVLLLDDQATSRRAPGSAPVFGVLAAMAESALSIALTGPDARDIGTRLMSM